MLAVLAMTFAVYTSIEQATARTAASSHDVRALVDAGLAHAKALLWIDAVLGDPRYDAYSDLWRTTFDGTLANRPPDVNLSGLNRPGLRGAGGDAIWLPVRNERGTLVGRYAVLVEDESAKINLNMASLLPPQRANEGLSPYEILLGDGGVRGLPLPTPALANVMRFRYGPNGVPGARGDDNVNNATLMSDGLDNNANGLIDELDEGVDELEEYNAARPYGDDRAFFSLREVWSVAAPNAPLSHAHVAALRASATLHSTDNSLRWDPSTRSWRPRDNLNVISARDIHRTLAHANQQFSFEGNQRQMRRLAATAADYRDENAVLSTVASEYGIEAVCFNEVLANEGSRLMLPYRINEVYGDRRVFTLAYFYSFYNYRNTSPVTSDNPALREKFDRTTAFGIDFSSVRYTPSGISLELGRSPLESGGYRNWFEQFKQLLRARGRKFIEQDRVIWPENLWKNSYLCVYRSPTPGALPAKVFKIERSTDRILYINATQLAADDYINFTSRYYYAQIRSWIHDRAYYAEHPQVSTWTVVPFLQPNTYYRVYIQETNLQVPDDDAAYSQHLSEKMDVDGRLGQYSEQNIHRLRYRYKDGEAIRADRQGCIDLYLTSSRECSPRRRNRFNAAYCVRPDIIELMNISDRPVSLRGWSLVANTGALAYELGTIDHAVQYSRQDTGRKVELNPTIQPNEYFYLCNNLDIFDRDFGGTRDGLWGTSADEQMPAYEINDDRWGVRFKIKSLREVSAADGWTTYVTCENENWRKDQFKDEIAEFQSARRDPRGVARSPDGIRYSIDENTRNTLVFKNLKLQEYSFVEPGDFVMIVGLPRIGGFVSLTLKNQYEQIAARVIEYGNPSSDLQRDPRRWLGWSAEKPDPTREEWVLCRTPTFGGTVRRARNATALLRDEAIVSVKNGQYASPGELARVRRIATWQQERRDARDIAASKLVQAAVEFFDTRGIRLDAEEEGAHLKGWRPAFGENTIADTRGITDYRAVWPVNVWSNQLIHMLSGSRRGETFAIQGNSQNRLRVVGRSVPSRQTFYAAAGDRYSLGPGYASSFYYTRSETDSGEWEWKNKRIPKATYRLFICGLNDSIRTTEFLEENYNPRLDIRVYDFEKGAYDLIARGRQYDKNDTIDVGVIGPRHISPSGGLRLRLDASGLKHQYCHGFAWFDYLYLAPVPVQGLVNVNTASPRILMALNGVDATLAEAIYKGLNSAGQAVLKPYRSVGDLLAVRGMTIDRLTGLANLVTVRSDQYCVNVVAQLISDKNRDGTFDERAGDRIEATAHVRAILDRSPLQSPDVHEHTIKELSVTRE
ncbi:MAG: hypothetical protein N2595_09390 [bacterium]|nr:hypothetical protein [bacterium]